MFLIMRPDTGPSPSSASVCHSQPMTDATSRRNEMIRKFNEEQEKEKAHNGPALMSLLIVGVVGLLAGAVIGEVAGGAPQLSPIMDQDLLLILAMVMGGPAIICGMMARLQRVQAGRLAGRTQGVVSESRISQREGGTKNMGPRVNLVRCTVSYEVQETAYTTWWEPGGAISAVDEHVGRRVMVSFDPHKPEDAEVGRPSSSYRNLMLAYGVFMALTGVCIALRHYPLL